MNESLPKHKRLERTKKRLTETFEELLLWLDDAREDTCYEQLFDYSLPAAELAAILGFSKPPFEHVAASPFELEDRVGNGQAHACRFQAIRVNSPIGMSRVEFRMESFVEELVRAASPRFYDDLRAFVKRWMRALSRLDIREVKLPECVFAMYDESAEALIFQEQHERELRGDTRSVLQDMLINSAQMARLAKLHNLSPEQTTELGRAMARSWSEAHPWNRSPSTPQGRTNVKSSGGTRGMTVEIADAKVAAIIASVGYLGLRKLAARVGCSHETLRKCPSVQPHLKSKVRPTGDARDISEVHVADTSAADPLEQLVEQEDLEKMLRTLGPQERSAVLEMTPQQQRELLDTWQAQRRDEREDARSKGTTRRRVV